MRRAIRRLRRQLFRSFERTSLEQPSPSLWDYLWLENHPTLMQRIAMAERWRAAQPLASGYECSSVSGRSWMPLTVVYFE